MMFGLPVRVLDTIFASSNYSNTSGWSSSAFRRKVYRDDVFEIL